MHCIDSGGPGNVRELRNVVSRALVMARGDVVELSDFELPRAVAAQTDDAPPATRPPVAAVPERIDAPARVDEPEPATRFAGVSQRCARILELFLTEESLTTLEVSRRADVPRRTCLRDLAALQEAGWIERSGKRRAACYRIRKDRIPTAQN